MEAATSTHEPAGLTPPSGLGAEGKRLGDIIVELGYAPREVVETAVEGARASGQTIGRALVKQGVLTPDQLARAVAERHGVDHVSLPTFEVDMQAAKLITPAAARSYNAVPIAKLDEKTLLVAMDNPANVVAVDEITMITEMEVRRAVAAADAIAAIVAQLGDAQRAAQGEVGEPEPPPLAEVTELRESAGDAPIIETVDEIIAEAVDRRASDIHFDARDGDMRVRYRVDGVVMDARKIPRGLVPGVVSRIKVMADLDIAERRVPQDGRVTLDVDNRSIDVRVVSLPTVHGESLVTRILDKTATITSLDAIGMEEEQRRLFMSGISRAHGAVLVTGPTGSGKSTTLYAALNAVNSPDKTILTIEDPVEYRLDGIKQIQVFPRAGLTFAKGLRSMLRADPDVIMVGEIRDAETAQIAVESALTGHLVLTTLHTNDAPTAVTRLIEMGIEPFLVASAIECVVAQRLARVLCEECRAPVTLSVDTLARSGFAVDAPIDAQRPVGCDNCSGTGYRGRTGLFEVMTVTDEVRSLALERSSADALEDVVVKQGMSRLRDDGLEKVRAGVTSLEEIVRVAGSA